MTWSGQNFDIISGVAALLFLPFINRRRSLAWIPNTIGLLLLINVIRVVVSSLTRSQIGVYKTPDSPVFVGLAMRGWLERGNARWNSSKFTKLDLRS